MTMATTLLEQPERLADTPYCVSRKHCPVCRRDAEIRENIERVFGVARDGSGCPEGYAWDDPRVSHLPVPRGARIETPPCDSAPGHATWCHRFGLPAGPGGCDACVRARDPSGEFVGEAVSLSGGVPRADGAGGDAMPFGAWFVSWMRAWSEWHGCVHREATGRFEERVCCGGRVKKVPVLRCARDGTEAPACGQCGDAARKQ